MMANTNGPHGKVRSIQAAPTAVLVPALVARVAMAVRHSGEPLSCTRRSPGWRSHAGMLLLPARSQFAHRAPSGGGGSVDSHDAPPGHHARSCARLAFSKFVIVTTTCGLNADARAGSYEAPDCRAASAVASRRDSGGASGELALLKEPWLPK